jgi:hypothetical protein
VAWIRKKKPGHKDRVRIGWSRPLRYAALQEKILLSTLVMDIQFGRQFRSVAISLVNDPPIQLF